MMNSSHVVLAPVQRVDADSKAIQQALEEQSVGGPRGGQGVVHARQGATHEKGTQTDLTQSKLVRAYVALQTKQVAMVAAITSMQSVLTSLNAAAQQ